MRSSSCEPPSCVRKAKGAGSSLFPARWNQNESRSFRFPGVTPAHTGWSCLAEDGSPQFCAVTSMGDRGLNTLVALIKFTV